MYIHPIMIMCGPVSSNKVKWMGTWSKVVKKTGIYLDVQILLTASLCEFHLAYATFKPKVILPDDGCVLGE
jgi:hypothetical protein